jgi:hypothetical protein
MASDLSAESFEADIAESASAFSAANRDFNSVQDIFDIVGSGVLRCASIGPMGARGQCGYFAAARALRHIVARSRSLVAAVRIRPTRFFVAGAGTAILNDTLVWGKNAE